MASTAVSGLLPSRFPPSADSARGRPADTVNTTAINAGDCTHHKSAPALKAQNGVKRPWMLGH